MRLDYYITTFEVCTASHGIEQMCKIYKKDAIINGLLTNEAVRILSVEQVGTDAITIYFKSASGVLQERMLFRSDETHLSLTQAGRPWAFDADGDAFKFAAEAYRLLKV